MKNYWIKDKWHQDFTELEWLTHQSTIAAKFRGKFQEPANSTKGGRFYPSVELYKKIIDSTDFNQKPVK